MSRERNEQIARVVFARVLGHHWPPKCIGRAIFEDGAQRIADAAPNFPPAIRDHALVEEALLMVLGPRSTWFRYRRVEERVARCDPFSVIAEVNKLFPPDEPSFAVSDVVVMDPTPELPAGWSRVLNSSFPLSGAMGGGAVGGELAGLTGSVVGLLAGGIIGVYAAWKQP